jgi:TonB family protein
VEFQWHTPPAPTNTTVPVYPTTLLQANTAGKATVVYVIGTDGRVLATKLIEATAPEFGYAALATLDAWRFEPAKKKDGSPSYARMSMTYEFKPNGHGDVPVTTGTKDVLAALKKKPELIASPGDLDKPLAPISRRPPVYPTAFLNEGTEGSAVIEFYIDRNGDAQLPSIVSSTAPEFGYAAMQAVATWRFESPRRDGKKVIVKARVSVNFSPEEPKGGSREAKVKQP